MLRENLHTYRDCREAKTPSWGIRSSAQAVKNERQVLILMDKYQGNTIDVSTKTTVE